jgi:hypothetical protein
MTTGQDDTPTINDELRDADPTISLDLANKAFGIGRSTGYTLAKQGEYPCKVLKLGTKYRAVTADVRRVLGLASR